MSAVLILKGHTSSETAYVVNDYPYGYRLRCMIRYWLEAHPRHGVRLVSQTTNPKRADNAWNKPKASTYSRFGGCMYLDEQGHVQWSGLGEYSDAAEVTAWLATYGEGNVIPAVTAAWLKGKQAYESARAEGADMRQAAVVAMVAMAKAERQP